MFKKIKSFIKGALIITSVIIAAISFTPQESIAYCNHTFVKVTYADGSKWIYEYDCDGSLINVVPDLT